MSDRRRLDAELVRRKIARSREQAVELIRGGQVLVQGMPAIKPATQVSSGVSIQVLGGAVDDWASRGAHKLLGALEAFEPAGLSVVGKKVLDAGASTGGFTDVLLRRGAREVVAVDVSYGQLVWRLQNDDRVRVVDRTNIRYVTADQCGGLCDVMVGDLSFISLTLVLPAIVSCVVDGGDVVPMVKPQFEVTTDVAVSAQELGLSLRGVVASPLPGPKGNVEYFLWLVKDGGVAKLPRGEVAAMVDRAVREGPE